MDFEPINQDDPDYIPDFPEFKKEIEAIYGLGDLKKGFQDMIFHVNNHKMPDGSPVSFKVIKLQYRAHIDWWDYMYKSKERKGMLPKEAETKRLNISDFITGKMYAQTWIISKGTKERELYIFGSFSKEHLMKELKIFKAKWKKGSRET